MKWWPAAFAAVLCLVYFIVLPSVSVHAPADERAHFSAEQLARLEKGAAYRAAHRSLYLISVPLELVLLAFLSAGLGRLLERWTGSGVGGWVLFALLSLLVLFVLTLPLAYVSGVVLERRWGFLRMSTGAWFWERVKALGIKALLAAGAAALLALLVRRFGRLWWLPASAAAALLSLLLVLLAPLLIDPLFAKFEPLRDRRLADRLLETAERAGVPAGRVLVTDASVRHTHTNAYFSGLWGTRRIVLYDTLLQRHPPDEVEVIVAHEAGHARNHDVAVGLLLYILSVPLVLLSAHLLAVRLFGEGFVRRPRMTAFVTLVCVAAAVLSAPVANYASRRVEARADLEALRLSGDPDAFIRAEVRLAVDNLGELHPGRLSYVFFNTHPTPLERIGMAEAFKAGRLR